MNKNKNKVYKIASQTLTDGEIMVASGELIVARGIMERKRYVPWSDGDEKTEQYGRYYVADKNRWGIIDVPIDKINSDVEIKRNEAGLELILGKTSQDNEKTQQRYVIEEKELIPFGSRLFRIFIERKYEMYNRKLEEGSDMIVEISEDGKMLKSFKKSISDPVKIALEPMNKVKNERVRESLGRIIKQMKSKGTFYDSEKDMIKLAPLEDTVMGRSWTYQDTGAYVRTGLEYFQMVHERYPLPAEYLPTILEGINPTEKAEQKWEKIEEEDED
ncbi:MAG: hypothetical protein WCK90_04405 [archaeon]